MYVKRLPLIVELSNRDLKMCIQGSADRKNRHGLNSLVFDPSISSNTILVESRLLIILVTPGLGSSDPG